MAPLVLSSVSCGSMLGILPSLRRLQNLCGPDQMCTRRVYCAHHTLRCDLLEKLILGGCVVLVLIGVLSLFRIFLLFLCVCFRFVCCRFDGDLESHSKIHPVVQCRFMIPLFFCLGSDPEGSLTFVCSSPSTLSSFLVSNCPVLVVRGGLVCSAELCSSAASCVSLFLYLKALECGISLSSSCRLLLSCLTLSVGDRKIDGDSDDEEKMSDNAHFDSSPLLEIGGCSSW